MGQRGVEPRMELHHERPDAPGKLTAGIVAFGAGGNARAALTRDGGLWSCGTVLAFPRMARTAVRPVARLNHSTDRSPPSTH
jgi:alpha-tubulin suppressor-like RCC1 family protein